MANIGEPQRVIISEPLSDPVPHEVPYEQPVSSLSLCENLKGASMSDSWLKPYEEALPSDMIVMPVVAYRIWYVPLQPILQLRSYHIQTPWTPCQRLEAECRNHMSCVCAGEFWTSTKREPEEPFTCSCSAGIYGWKTFDQAFEMWRDEIEKMASFQAEEPITNRVALGKVFLCSSDRM